VVKSILSPHLYSDYFYIVVFYFYIYLQLCIITALPDMFTAMVPPEGWMRLTDSLLVTTNPSHYSSAISCNTLASTKGRNQYGYRTFAHRYRTAADRLLDPIQESLQ
jgi:hypothetical protein